ncbi:PIG-L family deacetylase [Sporomusa sp.]|uniref:PIG-L deacetylase family protein n=1 Tax=Sporomusa sp. TaxID=2078658 RepID=UPI002D16C6F3|nr:PIG-L family deacetylase [Sporomusa sp.]HWR07626.1 PIG-L family deacetylase [Sporomusa sp.]
MILRYICKLLAAGICFVLIAFGIISLYFYYQEKPKADIRLPALPIVLSETRLLVIAPHCDDETLGCAGIMHDVLAGGGQVKVVVMTNGDGFTLAVKEQFHRLFLTSSDYIQSGYDRQAETYHALLCLGLLENQLEFLGYPDRGLRALWADNWDSSQPYRSRYTYSDHSPYTNSYQQNAPYAGEAVLDNLGQVIRDFKPTLILSPHPADEHQDHSATWAFVAAAFVRFIDSGISPKPALYTYLVHRGDFPIPHGYRTEEVLLPPRPLQSAYNQWKTYVIDAGTEYIKEQSVKAYVSQLRVPIMSSLLNSFIRKNELFEEVLIPVVKQEVTAVELSDLNAWRNKEPILITARGVNPIGVLEHTANIIDIKGALQDKTIWLRFKIPDFATTHVRYDVSIVEFSVRQNKLQREKKQFYFSAVATNLLPDNIIRFQDDVIIKIPYPQQGLPEYFFIQVLTKDRLGAVSNQTVWQPVLLQHALEY